LREGRLDIGYIAHPSFPTLEELSFITKPLSIEAAGKMSYRTVHVYYIYTHNSTKIDKIMTVKIVVSEKILSDFKVPYQINIYGAQGCRTWLRVQGVIRRSRR
jgi:hypothetical protein